MDDEKNWDHWLERIASEGADLTKWEEDFIASLQDRRAEKRRLTERQAEILERIYAEKTP